MAIKFIKIKYTIHSNTTRNRKLKKNGKKIQKYRYVYSFQANIGLKKIRNGENKNYRSVSFLPDAKLKIPKK